MVFAPEGQDLLCEHCDGRRAVPPSTDRIVERDFSDAQAQAPTGKASDLAAGAREVQCQTCGARLIMTTQGSRCTYCDTPMVVAEAQAEGLILPESLLPHALGLAAARA